MSRLTPEGRRAIARWLVFCALAVAGLLVAAAGALTP